MSSLRWLEQVRRWTNRAAKLSRQGRRPQRCRRTYRPWLEGLERRLTPDVSLSISNPAPFAEGDFGTSTAMFVVTRSGDLEPAVRVDFTTQDSRTAHAGIDYVATSGTLFFAPNQTTATIDVPIIGNTRLQSDRSFTVLLSNPLASAAFSAPQAFAADNARSVAMGDFNGDGRLDLAVTNNGDNTVSVFLNTTAPGADVPSFAGAQT